MWEAEDGDQALEIVVGKTPDLILLDFKLAGKSGVEMVLEFQSVIPQVSIIMVTNDADVKLVVRALRNGAYDYLLKPVDRDQLSVSIMHALEKRQLERKGQGIAQEVARAPVPLRIDGAERPGTGFVASD